MSASPRTVRHGAAASALAIGFCTLIGALSALPGWSYLLFPELAAVSTTVLQDPWGSWGRRPLRLIVVPALAAVLGLLISLHVRPMSLALLLAVLAAKSLLLLFRSPLVPAVSAAALPVILRLKTWDYPLQISLGLAAFCALLLLLRPWLAPRPASVEMPTFRPEWRGQLRWLVYLLPLLLLEHLSDIHTLLLPPLIVISHELLVTPWHVPWRSRSWWLLPLAFGSIAAIGLLTAQLFPDQPALITGLGMLAALLLLQRLRVHLAPVYAMAVLPQLLSHPTPQTLLGGVLCGSLALAATQHLLERTPLAASLPEIGPGRTGASRPDR